MKHNHRINPGHNGGGYTEGNVISVEVVKCDGNTASHAMWHYANWRLWGKHEDRLAWKGLSGFMDKEAIIQEQNICLGKEQGRINVEEGRGIFSKSYLESDKRKEVHSSIGRKNGPKVGAQNSVLKRGVCGQSLEKMVENGKKGGAIAGRQHAERNTGVCGQSLEKMRENARKATSQVWESTHDGFQSTAAGVASHNKKYGWDTKDKVRVG